MRAAARRWPVLLLGCFVGLSLGCASSGQGGVRPVATGGAGGVEGPEAGTAAWQIPVSELGTQRLFRLRYEGPEGEVSLRVTLRLATPERYRLSAADVVGRPVWTLSIEDGEGLWLDHRGEGYCRFTGAIDLEAVPLSPFRFAALPALLLGRLPESPGTATPDASGAREAGSEGRLEMLGQDGMRWTYETSGGEVLAWTLWRDGEPAAWWSGRGEEAILSHRGEATQIRWRQVIREPLAALPSPPEIPRNYLESCGS